MKRKIDRFLRRSLVVLPLVAGISVGLTLPAEAASGGSTGTGVRASYSWTWSRTAITGISATVYDTACDNNDVYGYIRLYDVAGVIANGSQQRWSGGCNTSGGFTLSGLRFSNSRTIAVIRIFACVDDAGGDSCWYSGDYANPYR
ncbi:hypothetical protein [Streptomyces sp. NPDC002588]|uniref:hypothetical protein n=1 Tax=Streptomyces sp. NPDC002588 TaxID=3154419 RepID=UPI0033239D0A